MAKIEELYPYIKPYAAGCPDVAINAEIIALIKVMAQKTNALRDTIYLDSQESWGMYEFSSQIESDRSLGIVARVCVMGNPVQPLISKPCDGCHATGYWVDKNKTLYIYPPPMHSQNDAIEIEYTYSPKFSSCDVDEDFLDRYGFDISKGVLGRILMMKDQKWYNANLAAKYDQEWKSAQVSALVDGVNPFSRAGVDVFEGAVNYLDT